MKKKYKSIIYLTLALIILALFFIFFSKSTLQGKFKNDFKNLIWPLIPEKTQTIIKILYDDKYFKRNLNDYNVRFLPRTQSINLDLNVIKIKYLQEDKGIYKNQKKKTFFIELINNHIWIIDLKGNIYNLGNLENIYDKQKNKIQDNKVETNNLDLFKVLDTYVDKGNIFISYAKKVGNCYFLNVSISEINNKLNFKNFFSSDECTKNFIQGGRLQKYTHNKKNGILITVGDGSGRKNDGKYAQDQNSIYGKILFKEYQNNNEKSYIIFSKGHRNPQGLLNYNNTILSTEHGPRGGDEINKIIYNSNYGWPIASYGKGYLTDKVKYKKSHKDFSFIEPIFSFIPSIGINEIIHIPNNFNKEWQNNFLVASLNDKSIYRLKFSKNFQKILYNEKIFIGQRIRDLKYDPISNMIILALETDGSIGIIKNLNY
jgi:hypothetical protein